MYLIIESNDLICQKYFSFLAFFASVSVVFIQLRKFSHGSLLIALTHRAILAHDSKSLTHNDNLIHS
ncbi:hypothetical protein HOF65_05075 [bacterium]|nr:hypothetical protein [bacterium]MBT3853327.1 hypothetical protein [bacterium]